MTPLEPVDAERWQRAQAWELEYWHREETRTGWKRLAFPILRPLLAAVGSRRVTGDAWNLGWCEAFDGYAFLPSNLGDFIELGCGPYTNTRLIIKNRSARRIVCSDPLADEYLGFHGRWLADAAKKGIVEIDSNTIENCPFPSESFDVVVLINVLDHVRDPATCMRTAIGLLRPAGYFIFGQDLGDPASEGKYPGFEEGHPFRLTAENVAPFLTCFDPILAKTIAPRDPRLQTGVFVFAGQRR